MQLKGSVFLVTGGASGLGAATVRMAIENGAKAVIADVQDGSAYAKEFGANARYIKTDVTSEADGKAAPPPQAATRSEAAIARAAMGRRTERREDGTTGSETSWVVGTWLIARRPAGARQGP